MLAICWAGHRLRLGSAQRCLPKHWDDKRQHVKEKPASYAGPINQVLDDYTFVAQTAEREALQLGQVLTPEQRYAAIVAERAGRVELPPTPVAVPLTFFDHFDRWIEKKRKNFRTHRAQAQPRHYLDPPGRARRG